MTTRKLLPLLFAFPLVAFFMATPAHANCFCSPTVYSSTMSGSGSSGSTCSELSTDMVNSAQAFSDLGCSDKGFEAACDVQVQLGSCQTSGSGITMSGTFSYRCYVCVDREPPPHH